MDEMNDFFGEPIYVYTRKQAIEDGVLVDVSKYAKPLGFKLQTCITEGVNNLLNVPERLKGYQDYTGRLHDILNMAMFAVRASISKGKDLDTVYFKAIIKNPEVCYYDFKIVLDGDGFTVLLINES